MNEDLKKYKEDLEKGLKVPEDYFSKKKKSLLAIPEMEGSDTKSGKLIPLWPKVLAWSFSAAAIISVSIFLLNPKEKPSGSWDGIEASLNEIDKEHIEDYLINEYIYGTDEGLLLSEVEFEDLN